jgi:hypothetical protein
MKIVRQGVAILLFAASVILGTAVAVVSFSSSREPAQLYRRERSAVPGSLLSPKAFTFWVDRSGYAQLNRRDRLGEHPRRQQQSEPVAQVVIITCQHKPGKLSHLSTNSHISRLEPNIHICTAVVPSFGNHNRVFRFC